MHRPPSPTEVSQTIRTVSCFRGLRRRMPPPGSGSGLILAPPAGREGRGECALAALPRNTKAFSGHLNFSLEYFKAPNGWWLGQLVAKTSFSFLRRGRRARLLGFPFHVSFLSAFLKPARSVDTAIQRITKKVYWFMRNPVLLQCVGNTLMSAQFARVNRDNGFGDLH